MNRNLTAAIVEAVKATPGRQVEYADNKQPGLALRVSPAGKKSWTLRYRTLIGQQQRLTLGRYPSVTLSMARDLARKALGRIADGADPAKEKRAERIASKTRKISTVSALIEMYLNDSACGRHKPNGRPKRESTLHLERDYFVRLIKPQFGSVPAIDLTRHEVQNFLDKISLKAPSSARHCRNLIRQAYNYGIRREVVEKNPAQFTNLARSESRDRVLADDEVLTIWNAAADPQSVHDLQLSDEMGLAICFAMVSLQRGGEVIGIHASELDRERRIWTIPGVRTKNHETHIVPLSGLALVILDKAFALAEFRGRRPKVRDNEYWRGYAFLSLRQDGPMKRHAFTRAMKRLTKAVKITDAVAHDFRRTGSTNITGERIGIPRFIVSRILNQLSDTGGAATVTGVYDRNEYLPEKRRALEAWSGLLEEITDGKPLQSNVVQMPVLTSAIDSNR